jgi:uncharacterized membrane protein HdeD (DUF308 family)
MQASTLISNLEYLNHRWDRSAQLGVVQIVLGVIALITTSATVVPVVLFGWLIGVSGIVEAVYAFQHHKSTGFFLHLIPGVAGIPIGLLIANHPVDNAFAWVLLFASYFTIIGLLRIISAFRLKFRAWSWAVFDGMIAFFLGILLWAVWP